MSPGPKARLLLAGSPSLFMAVALTTATFNAGAGWPGCPGNGWALAEGRAYFYCHVADWIAAALGRPRTGTRDPPSRFEALERGEGALVWVEGEPGIGKSALVAEALTAANQPGWDVGWGMADKLTERLPLRVMKDCLQVRLSSPDPRRAHAANLLRSRTLGLLSDGDALIVWHQLATSIDQLRLLLIATCRSPSRRPEVQQLRAAVVRRGGAVITLGPLAETDVAALVTDMIGAPPGDALRRLTARAAGNPLYVRELVDALVREHSYPSVSWPALLVHGVAALIAGRREQRTAAGQHLRQGLALPTQNLGDRENQDFLVAARALALEQGGETGQAMLRLAEILPRRDGEMTLT